ncbi:hypothetical protein Tco_0893321 [Tanacetum coccineum]|uniref:Remorin C-terminal domain-containing protein n=1 Tax=Tanacetum coccineum TaxID=301880 RepID=A0ABQ5CDV3_9ASTR
MIRTSTSFCTSAWMALARLRARPFFFCRTSVYPFRILSRCSAIDHGTPVMSDGCHANMSKFSFRSEHSSACPFSDSVPSIADTKVRSGLIRSRVSEGVSTQIEAISASDADSMWNALPSIIKDAAKDSLGVAIGTSKIHTARRESWWLCEKVQSKVAEKQVRFRELLSCRKGNQEERFRAQERYKLAKREAKKAVAQAKEKAYEELYKKLDTKEGANDIFRIAKARQRRRGIYGIYAL